MTEEATEGGCLCGAVRYRALGAPSGPSAFCHCRSCRMATGAPITAWVTFLSEKFSFTVGQPIRFRSSPEVIRTFCGACGTSLTYNRYGRQTIDVTTPSLDNPEAFAPTAHVFTSHALSWVHINDQLLTFKEWGP